MAQTFLGVITLPHFCDFVNPGMVIKLSLNDDDKLFRGMADRKRAFSFISSWNHCQRSSRSRIFDTQRAGFEPAQNLSSDFAE